MRHAVLRAFSLVAFAWALALLASPAMAQSQVRVEEVRADPEMHLNEIRTLEGVVDRLVPREAGEEPAFYLEDDFGHQLLVIPFAGPPARGDRIRATGVVSLDASGDPVLTVFDERGLTGASGEPIASPAETAPPTPAEQATGDDRQGPSLVVVGAVLLLVAALVVVAFQRGRASAAPDIVTAPPPEKKKDEVDIAVSALWPESEREFDGRTMRFVRPDPTVRLMSAKLEVIGGADVGEEIRFVGVPGEEISMMFGRAPGEGPTNVVLKQKTVSRTHAVVRHRHGEWLIENLSLTNPTVLNGETLGVKERLLTEGDRIEMGEVTFRFVE